MPQISEFSEIIETLLCRFKRHWKVAAASLAAIVACVGGYAAFELVSAYYNYVAIVDARLADDSLHHPPGIYAAPRRLTVGKRVTAEKVVEHLLRAGYVEGERAPGFAQGSFRRLTDGVEFRPSPVAGQASRPEVIRVSLRARSGKQAEPAITEIEDVGARRRLGEFQLPAEMLTADINMKGQTRRASGFADFPSILVGAVTAIEDRGFFTHHGIDPEAIVRALVSNWRRGRIREGGSTITQQLVKNHFLTPERTYRRKLAEAMMAVALERRLSKEQIFALYGDRIYLGHSGLTAIYGFKQAARLYFGRGLSELSLAQTALLAGLAQAPTRYSPYARPEEAVSRRNLVLDAMAETGAVNPAEAAAAKAEALTLIPPQAPDASAAAYFVDYLRRELAGRLDEESWPQSSVETTLDLDLQEAANQAVRGNLERIDKLTARRKGAARPEAALIALDPRTGEILAMVGGRDYTSSQLNRAVDAMRQPGSVFKPVVYATALSQGVAPTALYDNAPRQITYGYKAVYRPRNFGNSYTYEPVMLREAMVRSLNVITVEAAIQVGLGRVAEMAEKLGLPRPGAYPSMALGAFEATPLELASAYTAFANGGMRAEPVSFRRIRSRGEVLVEQAASKRGVISASTAYLITDTLADVVNRGTASRVRQLGYRGPAAGKTGTSRDSWFVGYTPNLLVAVWVGYDDHRDLNLTGGEAAVPLWTDFVKRALTVRPDLAAAGFARPSGIEEIEVDAETGMLANEYCPRRKKMIMATYLLPGSCLEHQEAVMTLNDEFLAGDGLPLPAAGESGEPILLPAAAHVEPSGLTQQPLDKSDLVDHEEAEPQTKETSERAHRQVGAAEPIRREVRRQPEQ